MTRLSDHAFAGIKAAERNASAFKQLETMKPPEREQWWTGFLGCAMIWMQKSIGMRQTVRVGAGVVYASSTEQLENMNEALIAIEDLKRSVLSARASADAKEGRYRCAVCLESWVSPEDGQDTCPQCLPRV